MFNTDMETEINPNRRFSSGFYCSTSSMLILLLSSILLSLQLVTRDNWFY